jgi:hypothetical protein
MMIKLLSEPRELRKEIARVVATGRPARAAVAFWGRDAANSLGISEELIKQRGLEVICDLESGCCDPDMIRTLLKLGAKVRRLAKLHAKVYLGNGEIVVGSANASANGLGLEDAEINGSKEVCVVTNDNSVISQCQSWFLGTWEEANDITDGDLKKADAVWRMRRKHRPMDHHSGKSLLKTLQTDVTLFANREIYVRVDMEDVSKAGLKTAEDQTGGDWTNHGVFEDWSDMPPDAEIIEFLWESKDKKEIKLDGLFRSPNDPQSVQQRTKVGSFIVICERLNHISGCYSVPSKGKDAEIWKNAARNFAESRIRPKNGCFLPLDEFARQFLLKGKSKAS